MRAGELAGMTPGRKRLAADRAALCRRAFTIFKAETFQGALALTFYLFQINKKTQPAHTP